MNCCKYLAFVIIGLHGFAQAQNDTTSPSSVTQDVLEEQPDTTGIWFHIRKRQIGLANAEFTRLQNVYPGWEPSDDLLSAMEELNVTESTSDKGVSVVDPEPAATEAQLLFGKLAAQDAVQWQQLPESTISRASRLAFEQQGNGKINEGALHELVGWVALSRNAFDLAILHFEAAKNIAETKAVHDGLQAAYQGKANAAIADSDWETLNELAERYNVDVKPFVVAEAWRRFDAGRYDEAVSLFEYGDEPYGRVLALSKSGAYQKAVELACREKAPEDLLNWCVNYWAQQQAESFEAGDFLQSRYATAQIKARTQLSSGQLELYAWASFHSQNTKDAIAAFTKLLQRQPEKRNYADALLTLTRDDSNSRRALAETFPIIADLITTERAQQAWQRKQFDRFSLLDSSTDPFVSSQRDISIVTGLKGSSRSGLQGLGNFDVVNSYVGMSDIWQNWRWQVRYDYLQLYSGAAKNGSWFGEGQVDESFKSITGMEDAGVSAAISHQREGGNFFAAIDYRLIDQPVNSEVTGLVGASWFLPDLTFALTAFHSAKVDSMLSTSGTFVESEGPEPMAWGRVLATGAKGLAAYSFAPHWSLATTISYATLAGESVEDNNTIYLRLDVNKNLSPALSFPLDYFRAGPFLSWQSYEKNLGGFTRGHGGYFSPQRFTSVGAYVELLTEEGAEWQLKSSMNLAYSWITQDEAPRFPLTDLTTLLPAENDTSFSASFTAEGQYRINPNWIISAYFKQEFAVEYEATQAGLQLIWHAGKSVGLTSDTLMLSEPQISGFAL